MSKIAYRVTQRDLQRLHVEAEISPDSPVSVLTMRENYGPARGFAAGICDVVVTGPDARAAVQPGRLLVASAAPFAVTYDCVLPAYEDAVSLLRGFRRGRAMFTPGMALFFRLHDQPTEYEIDIDATGNSEISVLESEFVDFQLPSTASRAECASRSMVVSRSRTSPARSERPECERRGHVHCDDVTDLERTYFAFGDFTVRRADRTIFVNEPNFPFAVDDLLDVWPRLSRDLGRMFGDDRKTDWTVVLFASDEHPPGWPGVGFSLPNGALISISAADDSLASPHTLWLLLHEGAHQWLGEAIGRANPADDWFFEGFTYFAACEVLARAGILAAPSLARLLSRSRRAVRSARSSGRLSLAHHGFIGAHRWNRLMGRRGGSLGNILAALVASHRGETLQGETLLAALAHASPDGVVPDFLLQLAVAAKTFSSADCAV